mgnify:FL=1
MENYGMINLEDESDYLNDKPKYYRLGWQDCRDDRPMRKFTLHNKEDAAQKEIYLIGYSDYIANTDWQHI